MKLRAHREYRNDISDISGILIEEREAGHIIEYNDISKAYMFLYEENIETYLQEIVKDLCDKEISDLKKMYKERNEAEKSIGSKVNNYIDNGANINAQNVDDVILKIKEKMK